MTDQRPAKTLAQLAEEQGISPVESIEDLAAKEPLADGEYEAFAAATRSCRSGASADLEARIENAVSRTLAADGWHVALSVRHRIAQAVMAVIDEPDEPDPAAVYGGDLTPPLCCCKRGLMCAEIGRAHV